jgi:hypothetical protein
MIWMRRTKVTAGGKYTWRVWQEQRKRCDAGNGIRGVARLDCGPIAGKHGIGAPWEKTKFFDFTQDDKD